MKISSRDNPTIRPWMMFCNLRGSELDLIFVQIGSLIHVVHVSVPISVDMREGSTAVQDGTIHRERTDVICVSILKNNNLFLNKK